MTTTNTPWNDETREDARGRLPYVTLVLRRDELTDVRSGQRGACSPGLAAFDALFDGGGGEVRLRWDALIAIWSAVVCRSSAAWFRARFGLQISAAGANLARADLSCAYLEGADLSGADLSCADLSRADLSCANLEGANLEGAYLEGANLARADLSCAYLEGADLSGADLSCAYRRATDLPVAGYVVVDGRLARQP